MRRMSFTEIDRGGRVQIADSFGRSTRIATPSTINGTVAIAATNARTGYPQALTTTPDSAPAEAPAKPMIRSDNPCADARRSSDTDSVSSVEPATIVHDQPSPTANSPAPR